MKTLIKVKQEDLVPPTSFKEECKTDTQIQELIKKTLMYIILLWEKTSISWIKSLLFIFGSRRVTLKEETATQDATQRSRREKPATLRVQLDLVTHQKYLLE